MSAAAKVPHWERYRLAEELANSITHGVGLAAAIALLPVLVVTALHAQDAWRVVSASIFGAMLVLLYATSTLYHAIPGRRMRRTKEVCRRIDHSAIYLLIAGTYTPFTLVTLRGAWGWTLFGIVWGLAVTGVALKSIFGARYQTLSVAVYVGMGWLVIVALKPLIAAVSAPALALLIAGGLMYTGGVLFYVRERRWDHAAWHVFVIAGSALHALAVLAYVLPPAVSAAR